MSKNKIGKTGYNLRENDNQDYQQQKHSQIGQRFFDSLHGTAPGYVGIHIDQHSHGRGDQPQTAYQGSQHAEVNIVDSGLVDGDRKSVV